MGYHSRIYAEAFSEFGEPVYLPNCDGWILKRKIPNTEYYDAMHCYPYLVCSYPDCLIDDIKALRDKNIISLTLILQPMFDIKILQDNEDFFDAHFIFKHHFLIDLSQQGFVHKSHRRNIKKAKKTIKALWVDPNTKAKEWKSFYDVLINRHDIKGMLTFSEKSFEKQLAVPGAKMVCAHDGENFVGALIWYVTQNVAYYHLGAYSEGGYKKNASFALFDASIDYFRERGISTLFLGAGAGITNDGTDGLTRFKLGWSTGITPVMFVGKIFDEKVYKQLINKGGLGEVNYFPKYRYGEF